MSLPLPVVSMLLHVEPIFILVLWSKVGLQTHNGAWSSIHSQRDGDIYMIYVYIWDICDVYVCVYLLYYIYYTYIHYITLRYVTLHYIQYVWVPILRWMTIPFIDFSMSWPWHCHEIHLWNSVSRWGKHLFLSTRPASRRSYQLVEGWMTRKMMNSDIIW